MDKEIAIQITVTCCDFRWEIFVKIYKRIDFRPLLVNSGN